jgi:hypothetical protein
MEITQFLARLHQRVGVEVPEEATQRKLVALAVVAVGTVVLMELELLDKDLLVELSALLVAVLVVVELEVLV